MEKKRAFAELIVIFVVLLLAAFGGIYLFLSREGHFSAYRESFRLRARLMAKSGLEKSLVLLKKAYSKGQYEWEYPTQKGIFFPQNEFVSFLEGGSFRILKIEPANIETKKGELGPYKKVPYVVNGVKKGEYTLYNVVVEGQVRNITVKLNSIVKVIKYEVSY